MRHKFEKEENRWFVRCLEYDKRFDPSVWKINEGICPHCGKNAQKELEERKFMKNRELKEQRSLIEYGISV